MAFKIFIFAALVAVVNAGFLGGPAVAVAPAIARYSAPAFYGSSLGYHAPLAYHSPLAYHAPIAVSSVSTAPAAKSGAPKSAANAATQDDSEVDPNPSYSFSYDVQDADTGDTKTQSESLENGVVKGSYSVVDPDGIKRTVEYTADAINGFNAIVNTEPSNVVIKTPVVKTVAHAPVVAARTVLAAAPTLYHAAPVAKVLSAPLTKVVSSPHAYSTSHFSYQPSAITYAAAPVHHKIIY